MDNVTRLCGFILCMGAYITIAYILYWICESWDRKSRRKSRRKIEKRRREFEAECERAGRAMHNRDETHKTVNMQVRKKPIRKAVGYFSDDFAQLLLK